MIKALLALVLISAALVFAYQSPALAFDPFSNPNDPAIDCTQPDVSQSAVCQDQNKQAQNNNSDPVSGSGGALLEITNIVSYIAGAAAIIVVIVSGIRYMTSSGDANGVGSAKSTLIGALVGIVIIVLARTLITYIVKRV